VKSYLQMMDTENNFPILTQSHPGKVPATSNIKFRHCALLIRTFH
jgi:hypothetical protein